MTYVPGGAGAGAELKDFVLLEEDITLPADAGTTTKTFNTSNLDIPSGKDGLDAYDKYDHFLLIVDNIDKRSTDPAGGYFRMGVGHPGVIQGLGADYQWALAYNIANGPGVTTTAAAGEADSSESEMFVTRVTSGGVDHLSAVGWFLGTQPSTYFTHQVFMCTYIDEDDFLVFAIGGGTLQKAGTVTGFQYANNGLPTFDGVGRIYGISDSTGP